MVLSSFRSEDHINEADGDHEKSKNPSLTPTASREYSDAFFHEVSLNVVEAQVEGIDVINDLHSVNGLLDLTHSGFSGALLTVRTFQSRDEYAITSPDAPHTLDEKIAKMSAIWKVEPKIAPESLASIQCPVLVMAGDDDVVRHDHTIDLFERIPLGQLAIVPGTSHGLVKEKPAIVQALIEDFLSDLSYPITRMPIKRSNPDL